jgi:hypothetical protein
MIVSGTMHKLTRRSRHSLNRRFRNSNIAITKVNVIRSDETKHDIENPEPESNNKYRR